MPFVRISKIATSLTSCAAIFTLMFAMCLTAAAQVKQLSLADFLTGLRSKKVSLEDRNRLLADAARKRGITFELTPEIERELAATGADQILISALKERTAVASDIHVRAELESEKPAVTQDFDYYHSQANQKLTMGDVDAALENFEKALELDSKNIAVYLERANVFADTINPEAAIADYCAVLELDPTNIIALKRRAAVYEKIGEIPSAIADYQKVLEKNPDDLNAKAALEKFEAAKAKALADAKAKEAEAAKLALKNSGPVDFGALQVFAKKLEMPQIPQSASHMGFIGTIVVRITLDSDGTILSAKAVDGQIIYRDACERAVKATKFNAPLVDGKPAKVSGYIAFAFK